ncbi:MAG: hypothetical protein R3E91_03540 [Chlamydiales bacterium]
MINELNKKVINPIDYVIKENEKGQKYRELLIAEIRSSQDQTRIKDQMISSTEESSLGLPIHVKSEKPKLPEPKEQFNGFKGVEKGSEQGKTLGIIAIIGEVMALQAKANSNFWGTLWKQASESMMMEVKFAPIIGTAVKSAYDAQSQATMAQANQAKEDGMINFTMFGAMMIFGGISEITSETDVAADVNAEQETRAVNEDIQEASAEENPSLIEEENSVENEEAQANERQNIDRAVNREESTFVSRIKKYGKSFKKIAGKAHKRLGSALGKGMQYAMGAKMASDGITGWFVDAKYQAQKAEKEQEEGQAQALSKMTEQYAQFYGQSFSRADTLTQGTQQNIDYAMNVLKSAADGITQTVNSMFRG